RAARLGASTPSCALRRGQTPRVGPANLIHGGAESIPRARTQAAASTVAARSSEPGRCQGGIAVETAPRRIKLPEGNFSVAVARGAKVEGVAASFSKLPRPIPW